jgi:hypothetical protein
VQANAEENQMPFETEQDQTRRRPAKAELDTRYQKIGIPALAAVVRPQPKERDGETRTRELPPGISREAMD